MPADDPHPIRLLLVDDHEVLRLGLRTLLERDGNITVVGEAGTVAAALAEVERLKPDVVLMDVRLPDGSGAEACREIRATCPTTRVLFLTSFGDEAAVLAAVFGGAQGYLLKNIRGEALIQAITTAATGGSILDTTVTESILTHMRALSQPPAGSELAVLSSQEQRVLALVADGQSNKEIAAALSLSDKTVKNYLNHIYKKLQVKSRIQAALLFSSRSAS